MARKAKVTQEEKIFLEAKERFKTSEKAWANVRKEALDDLRFVNGEQWDSEAKAARANRPCLTINRLPAYIDQIVGDIRANTPSIKVSPVDSEADPKTAEIIEGLIRNIQNVSGADAIYETAGEQAVTSSIGAFRILTKYAGNDSFDQDIILQRVKNQFTVYPDPDFIEPDASDMNWLFICETLSISEFERQYPDVDTSSWASLSKGESKEGWFLDNKVRVAEYYRRVPEKKTILLLSDGRVVDKATYQPEPEMDGIEPVSVVREREASCYKVEWYKLAGNKVIDGPVTQNIEFIPVPLVFGKELNIEGETHYRSLIRWAKEPQRIYNYMRSAHIEMVALAPKAPILVEEEQIEGHEAQWDNANVKPYPYLKYKNVPGAPLPQRMQTVTPQTGMVQEIMQSADEIKAVTSMFDPSMGAVKQDLSGKAIGRLQAQGNVSNSIFSDNLARAVRHAGRIILQLIPIVYDRERIVRILGADGESKFVQVNRFDPIRGVLNNLTSGKYDIVVSTGPSYATQRMEAADAQVQLIQAAPQLMGVIGDMVVKNFDWPGAQEMAERIKRTIPPNLTGDEDGQPPQPQQPQGPDPMQLMTMQMQMVEKEAQIAKIKADSILSIARAESLEVGSQIKQYQAMVEGLMRQFDAHMKAEQPQTQVMMPDMEQEGAGFEPNSIDPDQLAQIVSNLPAS